jgi:hypothetical protein
MTINRREFVRLCVSAAAVLLSRRVIAQPLHLRREIRSLSATAIATLRAGVAAMEALPYTDPFSWIYQASVHGAPTPSPSSPDAADAPTFWRKCQHHTNQFFPWHRWELLYWEEIMRQLSGSPDFALPYWDYVSNGFLPDAFRGPAAGNDLYDGTRDPSLNSGTGSLGGIFLDGMSATDFLEFQTLFELNPHDDVHGLIGGNMGAVRTAARDPIFWLHHANIDRHWVLWLRQGGGRMNPGGAWAATQFTFHTVSGVKNVVAGDAGATEPLGYAYDGRLRVGPVDVAKLLELLRHRLRFVVPKTIIVPPRPRPPGPGPDPGPWRALAAATGGFALDGRPTVFPLPSDKSTDALLARSLGSRSAQLALTLQDVRATKAGRQGGFYIQVFLVPSGKALSDGDARGAVSIGSFSTFSLSVAETHAAMEHTGTANIMLRLGESAKAMLLKSMSRDPRVVFVRRGLVDASGRELKFNMNERLFEFDQLRLEVRTAGK